MYPCSERNDLNRYVWPGCQTDEPVQLPKSDISFANHMLNYGFVEDTHHGWR